jgi:agmatinase
VNCDPAALDRLRRKPSVSFCNADRWDPLCSYDMTLLGIPSDCGMVGSSRSTAVGPSALRSASRIFPSVTDEDGSGIGWYDYSLGRAILPSRRIADAGDVQMRRYRPLDSLEEIPLHVRRLRENTKLLVLVGGDHAITYFTAQGLDEGLVLLFVDAHEDATAMAGDLPHNGNVVSFLEQRSEISAILQFGLRGLVPHQRRQPAPHRKILRTREQWCEAVRENRDRPMMLSIDIDVLDPVLFGSVASPSPGGMTPAELVNLVVDAREAGARIQALEIVEFAPVAEDGPLPAVTLAQLVLRLADACLGAT